MKFDAYKLPSVVNDYDVCIIGSGPAGLTVALELMHSGQRICVLESGGLNPGERENADLKDVESRGIVIRADSRERGLGGTSETWSGFMAPLDLADFEARPGLHEGWPISPPEIASHIDRKGHRFSIPPSDQFEFGDESLPLASLQGLHSKTFQVQLKPLRFRKAYEHAFLSPHLDLIYGATATKLLKTESDGAVTVEGVEVLDRAGNKHTVGAKTFVLAASAIESVRIALHSEIKDPHDQIGRNFMNHPKGNVAKIFFSAPISRDHPLFLTRGKKFGRYIGLRLPDEHQRKQGHLNAYLRLEPAYDFPDRPHADRLSSAFRRLKRERGEAGTGKRIQLAWNVVVELRGLPGVISKAVHRAKAKKQKFVTSAVVRCFTEMEPLPENRITLSEKKDRFGVPLPTVAHANSVLSVATVEALLSTLKESLATTGLGRVEKLPGELGTLLANDASHHLGGLRMGSDPKTSVVDQNLKFHNVENLYAAGGAVFPTGGSANPTMTVIALSIRLAEKLRQLSPSKRPAVQAPREESAGFLIVGAGRRVREDVVPTIENLPGSHVAGIYSTSKHALYGLNDVYEVAPLSELNEDAISGQKYLYVAVPPGQLKQVLELLTRFDCADKVLIVDTPAILETDLKALYSKFAKVVVAEDCAYLPWIPLLKNSYAPVERIEFNRSGFAYHAVALGRAIAANGGARPLIKSSRTRRDRTTVEFSNGISMAIVGQRDYRKGTMRFVAADDTVVASHPFLDTEVVIQPVVENGRCIAFRQGPNSVSLSDEEVILAGSFSSEDSIVSRMLDIKRVGLHRLLSELLDGGDAYTLSEGVSDAKAAKIH